MRAAASPIRVLVVCDHPIVLDGIRSVLDGDPDIAVVGTAASADQALAEAVSTAVDVALIELRLEGGSGLDLIAELREKYPGTRCLALAAFDDAETFREALAQGAHGYLLDDATRAEVRSAVRRVGRGMSYFAPAVSGYLLQSTQAGHSTRESQLTAREADVLRLVAQGMTNDAIATRLNVKTETVKTHLSRAFERLGAHDRANAVAICMRRGVF